MVQLTLLQLSLGVGGKPLAFAPHIWKTLLDLRTLEVEYREEFVVSAQLEKELPERFGLEKVTIPASSCLFQMILLYNLPSLHFMEIAM